MRKHNEGYTLVLVMVVVMVLYALTTVILTAAERNLEAHKHGVQYMQNKYLAQGEIEKVLGYLEAHIGESNVQLPDMEDYENLTCTPDVNKIRLIAIRYEEKDGEQYEVLRIDCTIQITNEDGDLATIIDGNILELGGYSFLSYKVSTDGGAE